MENIVDNILLFEIIQFIAREIYYLARTNNVFESKFAYVSLFICKQCGGRNWSYQTC